MEDAFTKFQKLKNRFMTELVIMSLNRTIKKELIKRKYQFRL